MSTAAHSLNAGLKRTRYFICALFFLSGFPALFYQLTWQRTLFRIFGVNAESVTVIVAAFMLGLGLGSLVGGAISKRKNLSPLLALGCIELCIGITGMISLTVFEKVGQLVLGLPLPEIAAIVFGLLLIPTLLMGATLPVLVAYFAPRMQNTGDSVGTLYYINTLGAGTACFVASFILFPFFGMKAAVFTGAMLNLVVGLCAVIGYFFSRREGSLLASQDKPKAAADRSSPLIKFKWALFLAGIEGFISLSYEILFFRILSFATGSSAFAFSITLGVFLLGLASGAKNAAKLSRKLSPEALVRRLKGYIILAIGFGFAFLPFMDLAGYVDLKLADMTHGQAHPFASSRPDFLLPIAWIMVFLTAQLWGFFLPCLTQLSIKPDKKSGLNSGYIYVSNIVGSTLGSIVTGFFLLDWFNLVGMASLLVVLSVGFLLAFAGVPAKIKQHRFSAIGNLLALLIFVPFAQHCITPNLLKNLQEMRTSDANLKDSVENRHGIITVDNNDTVYGNGIYDGRFNVDLVHDTNGVFRPFGLSLYHPAPRDVLMIGLSSGSWAQIVAHNPAVKHLTIVEINSGYLDLIGRNRVVKTLLSNPKVTIIIDDGRRWLNLHPERKFDAVMSNTSYHFRFNSTNLLSGEFLGIIKQHLKTGGIFFYNTTDSTRVQRTGCQSFKHGMLVFNHLLVSDTPFDLNFDRWKNNLEGTQIDGKPVIDENRPEDKARLDVLMSMKDHHDDKRPEAIVTCKDILARSSSALPITDDNMGTEWRHGFFPD